MRIGRILTGIAAVLLTSAAPPPHTFQVRGADFLLDVPLVGKAVKLGTLGRVDNSRIIDNGASSFAETSLCHARIIGHVADLLRI